MKYLITVCLLLVFTSCNDKTDETVGYLALTFEENQDFNPNIEHGQIIRFKVTVTSSDSENSIVQYFSSDTEQVEFEGFSQGSTVRVEVDAINENGLTVRKGRSDDITIQGGEANEAAITINNVPIFANVRDSATVKVNRFVPTIFAPGEIEFEISDAVDGSENILQDQVSGSLSFSISENVSTATMPVYIPNLSTGEHQLTVRDINTGESSTITVHGEESHENVLTTTAGEYVGSPLSSKGTNLSNLILFYRFMTE